MLPPDDSTEGFDNIADVLGTSPALIERYIGAAAKISRLAVGNTDLGPLSTTYKVRGDLSQDRHIEGLPVGTRGGILIRHNFPVDGEYLFKFSLLEGELRSAVRRRRQGRAARDERQRRAGDAASICSRCRITTFAAGRRLAAVAGQRPAVVREGGRRRGAARSPAADESRTADDRRHLRQEDARRTSTICSSASTRRRPISRPACSSATRRCRICRAWKSSARTTSPVPATRRAARGSSSAVPPPRERRAASRRSRPARGRSCRRWRGAPSGVR